MRFRIALFCAPRGSNFVVRTRTRRRVRSQTPANANRKNPSQPFKPPQSLSIVEASISWQRRRVFYRDSQHFPLLINSLRPAEILHRDRKFVRGVNVNVRHSVCSSSDGLVARLAVPDSDGMSLDGGLSAECADVFGVLSDFHLLDLLSEGGTVSGLRKIVSALLLCRFSLPSNPLRAMLEMRIVDVGG